MAERLTMKSDAFLSALTLLSVEHGIGIAGEPETFVLVAEDHERAYRMDDDSRLIFD